MSNFKRFNSSDNNNNYDSSYVGRQGELTWDPNNGLRLHDGSTYGGNPVGGSNTVYWGDVQNKPLGNTALYDLLGGASSTDNGKFLQQVDTGVTGWSSLPTTYDSLTINTNLVGGLVGAGGTKITGITATLGTGAPYKYAFLDGNSKFGNLFDRGSSIIGWKIYPSDHPDQFVTITEYLNWDLGAPSLGFSGSLGSGPWTAESSDYTAGTPGPLRVTSNNKSWTFSTTGKLQLPAGGDIVDSTGTSVLGGSGSGSYGDSNVSTLLSSFGSNTITTTGNANIAGIALKDEHATIGYYTISVPSGQTLNLSADNITTSAPISLNGQVTTNSVLTGMASADFVIKTNDGATEFHFTPDGHIKDKNGNSINFFDQSVNTTNDVAFNTITTAVVTFNLSNIGSISEQYTDNDRVNLVAKAEKNIVLRSDGGTHDWRFDADGNIHLPAGGTIVDSTGADMLARSQAGVGTTSYSDVWVLSTKGSDTNFWTPYRITGNLMAIMGGADVTGLSNQTIYGKQLSGGSKVLTINNGAIESDTYGIVIEFPSAPTVGDTLAAPLVGNTGVGKLIFKPYDGQVLNIMTFTGGQPSYTSVGASTSYVGAYMDATQTGLQPITWVYAGLLSGVPTWYQLFF